FGGPGKEIVCGELACLPQSLGSWYLSVPSQCRGGKGCSPCCGHWCRHSLRWCYLPVWPTPTGIWSLQPRSHTHVSGDCSQYSPSLSQQSLVSAGSGSTWVSPCATRHC